MHNLYAKEGEKIESYEMLDLNCKRQKKSGR